MGEFKPSQGLENSRNFKDYLILGIKGFCMGAADVVPGVSGGTMAFILGIYRELIESIRSLDLYVVKNIFKGQFKKAFKHTKWPFLLPVAMGILTAIFSIAQLLSWLLDTHPIFIWAFFFGLVLASIIYIAKELESWRISMVAWMMAGSFSSFYIVGQIPAETPETAWFLFFSGALAICAMILPGISGAFILVLLGKYAYVLNAVKNHDYLILLIVSAGAAFGLVAFVRVLHWLFHRYQQVTIALLSGLMLGSLRKIWPFKESLSTPQSVHASSIISPHYNVIPAEFNQEVILALIMMLIGVLIVALLNFMANRKRIHPTGVK
jgi:putative membrane protein